MEEELNFFTFFRKMKKLEVIIATLFSRKDRLLLEKQDCFVLDPKEKICNTESQEIDSESETGPKMSEQWWEGLTSWNTRELMAGILP